MVSIIFACPNRIGTIRAGTTSGNMQKTVAFHTLGCKLNFAETSTLARQFSDAGYQKSGFEQGADVYVVNTCSVTEDANRECRRIVRQALRHSPEAFVIVTGCYAQLKPEEIASIPGVDLVLGAAEKFQALSHLDGLQKKEKAEVHSCQIEDVKEYIGSYSVSDRTRAFLKVQDGCDYTCTYCTIPMARGASRSDSIAGVMAKAREIAARGVREVVLTGVNIGDFGNGQDTFAELIRQLDTVEGIDRFRISSIEPNLLTNAVIEFVSGSEKFVPHFHIPLQSGSDRILASMKRRYKRALYADRVGAIRRLLPHACIGVDVIVGFPGETEDDFMETYRFLDTLDVNYFHVFTYSERDNTEALHLRPVVPMEERRKRNKVLRNLSAVKLQLFYARQEGTERTVLFESENKDGFMFGFTDNYVKVKSAFDPAQINTLQSVLLGQLDPDGTVLAGEPELVASYKFSHS